MISSLMSVAVLCACLCCSDGFASEVTSDSAGALLEAAFQKLPNSQDFIAQIIFSDERTASLTVKPAETGRRLGSWSISVSCVSGRTTVVGDTGGHSGAKNHAAFTTAVKTLEDSSWLKFPCRVSTSEGNGYIVFTFAGLPLTPGRSIAVRVDRETNSTKIIRGK
jgi:hypothetical protein